MSRRASPAETTLGIVRYALLERFSACIMRGMKLRAPLLTLLIVVPAMASSDDASRGKALIEQAREKTNIFSLPSFRLKARVRLDNFGKPLDGTYSLLWNGPDQWREEIAFPGYSE